MANKVEVIFVGIDQLDPTIEKIRKGLGNLERDGSRTGRQIDSSLSFLKGAVVIEFFRRGASAAVEFGKDAVAAFNQSRAAALGLQSVALFRGIGGERAIEAARNLDLVKNGLVSIGDASLALKNLLASGFSLDQSIELIKRFGDSAAFGRQAALEFGYAITSATEGIKNGNSILVDNAGVTKNLSIILKEAGFAETDLARATTDAGVRQALYNGLLKETQSQVGNAAKLSKEFAGEQARLDAAYTKLLVSIGAVVTKQPELLKGTGDLTQTIVKLAEEIGTEGSGANKAIKEMATLAGYGVDAISALVKTTKELGPVFDAFVRLPSTQLLLRLLGFGGFDSSGRIAATDALINRLQIAINDTPEALQARVAQSSTAGAQKLLAANEAAIQASIESGRKAEEAAQKRYEQTQEKALREIAKLQIETAENPLVKLWDEAAERQREWQREFAKMPAYLRRELDRLNQQVTQSAVFKLQFETGGRLFGLQSALDQIQAGQGGAALRQEDTERRARRVAIEQEIYDRRRAGTLDNLTQTQLLAEYGKLLTNPGASLQQQQIQRQIDFAQKRLAQADQTGNLAGQQVALDFLLAATGDVGRLNETQVQARTQALERRLKVEEDNLRKQIEAADKMSAAGDKMSAAAEIIKKGFGIDLRFNANVDGQAVLGQSPGADSLGTGQGSPRSSFETTI